MLFAMKLLRFWVADKPQGEAFWAGTKTRFEQSPKDLSASPSPTDSKTASVNSVFSVVKNIKSV